MRDMGQQAVLHMIIGRLKSPNHSNDRRIDDSHEIKKQILKEVRRRSREKEERDFSKIVGDNPDIGEENGIIILKGRGKFRGKIFRTVIPADTYFGLQFISGAKGQFEISILIWHKDESANEIFEFDDVYLIPNDDLIIELVFEKLYEDYLKDERLRKSIILVSR